MLATAYTTVHRTRLFSLHSEDCHADDGCPKDCKENRPVSSQKHLRTPGLRMPLMTLIGGVMSLYRSDEWKSVPGHSFRTPEGSGHQNGDRHHVYVATWNAHHHNPVTTFKNFSANNSVPERYLGEFMTLIIIVRSHPLNL